MRAAQVGEGISHRAAHKIAGRPLVRPIASTSTPAAWARRPGEQVTAIGDDGGDEP